ncbi:MAG: hypothetical protein L6Q57_04030 [Alphaproteobacteria bacterium]|nr:hypothetical protein [Alphaproteobacteria bacterium]
MKRRTKPSDTAIVSNKILPDAPLSAVQAMIKISEQLLNIAHRESQALVQQDILTLSVLQDEKEAAAHKYAAASQEFRDRLKSFRTVDKTLIRKLESLQNALADQSRANNIIVSKIQENAKRLTEKLMKPVTQINHRIHMAAAE